MTSAEAVEYHPFGYDWRHRFEAVQILDRSEGGARYCTRGEGAFWMITDEGTLADFFSDDDPIRSEMVRLQRFNSRERWDEAVRLAKNQVAARRFKGDRTAYEAERTKWQATLATMANEPCSQSESEDP